VGEHRTYKFDVQVDHNKSQPMDNKLSLKGTWSRHVTHFKFLPHDALQCIAQSCYRMSSVCLSVTLVDHDDIG